MSWGLLSALTIGCADTPVEPGEWGTVRYFANVLGEPPLRLIPPLADRAGNTYVLYGAPDWFNTLVSRLSVTGDRPTTCDPDPADTDPGVYGLHGWVGRSLDRVWYWTGTALVEVGSTGSCEYVLRTDPVSNTEVRFVGVAPAVDDTPSRRFATALVQGGTGAYSFTLVDLDRRLPFNTEAFPPGQNDVEVDDLRVVATGALEAERQSVFVVAYSKQVQAFFLDRLGQEVARRDVALPVDTPAYAVLGFLQFDDGGRGAGLLPDGRLFTLSRRDSAVVTPPFDAQGILRWQGELFVTGTEGGTPVVARLDPNGDLTGTVDFRTVIRAEEALLDGSFVNDERSRPLRRDRWDIVQSGIGERPLITPWPVDPYTNASVGWLLAGPSFATGIEPVTAVGFAPLGVEVP